MTPEEMAKEIRNEAERNRKVELYTADMQYDNLEALKKMLTLTKSMRIVNDEEYETETDYNSGIYDYCGWRVVTVEAEKFPDDWCIVSAILIGFCFEKVE